MKLDKLLEQKFDKQTEKRFRRLFNSLGEKDARHFAGAIYNISKNMKYVCALLNVCEKTVRKGLAEISDEVDMEFDGRQRSSGGGRKSKWDDKDLNECFLKVIEPHTAGDPEDENIKWTHLTVLEIMEMLKEQGFHVSRNTMIKVLKHHNFKKRVTQRNKTFKSVKGRDEQFNIINEARDDFEKTGDPVLSLDTKKKENIGDNNRYGECLSNGQLDGPDHDYPSLNEGKAVPHGIYDLKYNHACVNIGKGSETANFLADSIIFWWFQYGISRYPLAKRILMLFDSGGANSCRSHLFKKAIIKVRDALKLDIVIKHYPSYCSKWNPIEHRVFCHISRVIQGGFVKSYDGLRKLISRAKTLTGLVVDAHHLDGDYEIGERGKIEDWQDEVKLDEKMPLWNYICPWKIA